MGRAPKERPGPTYRCPHCGERIFRLPGNHERIICNRCRHRYMVMIDQETATVAFVDQADRGGPEPLWLPRGSIRGAGGHGAWRDWRWCWWLGTGPCRFP